MKQASRLIAFFGPIDPALGAFGLLALDPSVDSDEEVKAALDRRLAQLAAHPQSGTPGAHEVRLALFVAAAQLLDARSRRELQNELAASSRGSAPGLGAPARAIADDSAAFERTALWVLARAGGWNDQARRRIGALSRAYGVDPHALPAIIASLGRRARRPRAPRSISSDVTSTSAAITADAPAPRPRTLPPALTLAALVVMLVSLVVMTKLIVSIRVRAAEERRAALAAFESEPDHSMPAFDPLRASTPDPAPDAPRPDPAPANAPRPARSTIAGAAPELPRLVRVWGEQAHQALASPRGTRPFDALERAERFARLNLAAARLWARPQDGDDIFRDLAAGPLPRQGLADPAPSLAPFDPSAPAQGDDGALALRLLAARRQPSLVPEAVRLLRLSDGPKGPVDADVLAEVALFSAQAELKSVARRILREHASDPLLASAVLEALPRAPRDPETADLIQAIAQRRLPPPAHPEWVIEARAALVARLLERLGAARAPDVDSLAASLAVVYSRLAQVLSPDAASAPAQPAAGSPMIPDAIAVLDLWLAQLPRSDPLLAELQSRADARGRAALGPIQSFIAQQHCAAEALLGVVAIERPSRQREVERLGHDLISARRGADSAWEQLLAGEVAMLNAWLVRLDVPAPPSTTPGGSS